jgi:hypothetical protein
MQYAKILSKYFVKQTHFFQQKQIKLLMDVSSSHVRYAFELVHW